MKSTRCFCQILLKFEFSQQIFEKVLEIKFHQNPSSGSRVVQFGQMNGRTDITKLVVAFRTFANAHKKFQSHV
jgi:hypothetical protein